MMNYEEAVKLAKAGDETGYRYLYDQTYQSKYYLALQYMKNEEAAKDVMQDAYLKAFTHLDDLKEPVAFPEWLGRIVANTAKNILERKNPILFSDLESEDENFEYQIEDDNVSYQPETAYTRQETQILVHELIDALSEEQRLCILMFHIEGFSIQTIASTLGCSENTVKSRLNYGRKNIKKKAEELQKKGYKLYSLAPIPLLLYLLRQEETIFASEGVLSGGYHQIWGKVSVYVRTYSQTDTNTQANAKTASDAKMAAGAKTAAAAGAVKGGMHLTAGKIIAAAISLCVLGGAAYYGISHMGKGTDASVEPEKDQVQTIAQEPETTVPEMETTIPETETDGEEEQVPAVAEMTDADYPEMISGNLTREELEYVLAYGPEEIPEDGFEESDFLKIVNAFCERSSQGDGPVEYYGVNEKWQPQFSLEDVNRLFMAFTDFAYTEENDTDTEYGLNVEGDILIYTPATLNYTADAEIVSAEYTEEEMRVYFTYNHSGNGESVAPQTDIAKVAVLEPTSDGLYRIVRIEEGVSEKNEDVVDVEEETPDTTENAAIDVTTAYTKVLQSIQNGEAGYTFENVSGLTGFYQYFLYDMNGDGIDELIVGAEVEEDVFLMYQCRIYTCDKSGVARPCEGEFLALGLYLAGDGNGLYSQDFSRGTGAMSAYRITLQENSVVIATEPEYEFTMGDAASEQFRAENASPEWKMLEIN